MLPLEFLFLKLHLHKATHPHSRGYQKIKKQLGSYLLLRPKENLVNQAEAGGGFFLTKNCHCEHRMQ